MTMLPYKRRKEDKNLGLAITGVSAMQKEIITLRARVAELEAATLLTPTAPSNCRLLCEALFLGDPRALADARLHAMNALHDDGFLPPDKLPPTAPTPTGDAPTVEQVARMLAFWHGQKISGPTRSIATDHGFGAHGGATSDYSDAMWKRYDAAAEYVIELIHSREAALAARIVDLERALTNANLLIAEAAHKADALAARTDQIAREHDVLLSAVQETCLYTINERWQDTGCHHCGREWRHGGIADPVNGYRSGEDIVHAPDCPTLVAAAIRASATPAAQEG